jgi:DNA-binding GntR family transcriptional regulator
MPDKETSPVAKEPGIKVDRSSKTLRELTLDKVRMAILNQYFKPGQRLIERSLCEELGVSRTVVREVLRHLETEGLVQSVPQQGPIVAVMDADTTRQIYEVRSLLEGHAAAGCAQKATPQDIEAMRRALASIDVAFARKDYQGVMEATTQFYRTLFLAAGDTMAWEIVSLLNARINRLRLITISSSGRASAAPSEMFVLLNAIERRDAAAASLTAREHVQSAQAIAMQHIAAL